MNRILRGAAFGALTLALAIPLAPLPAVAAPPPPILDGLAGPLGLAVGDDGTIYVTEAFAGTLISVDKNGAVRRLIDAPGQEIAGVDAKGAGTTVFTQTLFDGASGEEAPPLDAVLGRVQPNGKTSQLASLQGHEEANNPDSVNEYGLVDPSDACLDQVVPILGAPSYTGYPESHPYAVAIVSGGYLVADAAANAIFHVGNNGRISTVAVLPPVQQVIDADAIAWLLEEGIDVSDCEGETFLGEPVPTDIEVGPDSAYYVSTLPGFPENAGAGAVWRLDPKTGDLSLVVAGLSGPTDLAIARDGTVYVAELFGYQISKIVSGAVVGSVFADSPGAIEIARDGAIYATVGVFADDGGSLVRVAPF